MLQIISFLTTLLLIIGWVGMFIYNIKGEVVPSIYVWLMFPAISLMILNWFAIIILDKFERK